MTHERDVVALEARALMLERGEARGEHTIERLLVVSQSEVEELPLARVFTAQDRRGGEVREHRPDVDVAEVALELLGRGRVRFVREPRAAEARIGGTVLAPAQAGREH